MSYEDVEQRWTVTIQFEVIVSAASYMKPVDRELQALEVRELVDENGSDDDDGVKDSSAFMTGGISGYTVNATVMEIFVKPATLAV